MRFEIAAICVSAKRGMQKKPVEIAEVVKGFGIKGDGHAGTWHRQITLLAEEATPDAKTRIRARSDKIYCGPGAYGENILTRGVDWRKSKTGEKIQLGDVLLEITQIGKEISEENIIFKITGEYVLPENGVFARVLQGGSIRAGDIGHYPV